MTTSTTQREADERALFESKLDPLASRDGAQGPNGWYYFDDDVNSAWSGWMDRAAIDQSTRQAAPEAPTLSGMRFIIDPTMPPGTMRLESGEHSVTMTNIDFATPAAIDQPSAGQVDDHATRMAEKLAKAVAKYFKQDIGVHSSSNCSWGRALVLLEDASLTPAEHDYSDPTLACESCGLTMGESRTLGHIKLGILAAPEAASQQAGAAVAEVLEGPTVGMGIPTRDIKFLDSRAKVGDKLYLAPQAATTASAAASQAEPAEPLCPACQGSGEGMMMEGAGPDAYEVPCNCPYCGGSGGLLDAYNGLVKLLADEREKYMKACGELYFALAAPVQAAQPALPSLTVWEGAMPESNGKSNFTAVLHRKDAKGFDAFTDGFTIARSEYPDRVRYEADKVRWIIGERAERPELWDEGYDFDKHSGYVAPGAAQTTDAREGGA